MRKGKNWLGLVAVAAVFTLAPNALATDTSITLTSVSGGSLGGVYTSPYIGTVGGQTGVDIICDDFVDNSYLGEGWTATVQSYTIAPTDTAGSLSGVDFSGGYSVTKSGSTYSLGASSTALTESAAYTTAAVLAIEILQAQQNSQQTAQNQLSFALWTLFAGPAVLTGSPEGLGGDTADQQAALNYLYSAENASSSAYAGATITVYDYVQGTATGLCDGCAPPPQEFLAVSMPEPSGLGLLGIDLFAVAGLMVAFRRRISRIVN